MLTNGDVDAIKAAVSHLTPKAGTDLRDQFAMAALTGLLAHYGEDGVGARCKRAYCFANLMMEARKR